MTHQRKKSFVSPIAECPICRDIIYSRYPGDWRCCRCWEASQGETGFYMDITPYYGRWSGAYRIIGKTYVKAYKEYAEEAKARRLSKRDSLLMAEKLLDPPDPNEKLKELLKDKD